MMTQVARRVFTLAMVFSAIFTIGLALSGQSDTARATVPAAPAATVRLAVPMAAKAHYPKQYTAMKYAKAQIGDPYRYGGTGPSSWDCSGLVQAAYRHAGISLPRTTGDMQRSPKLQRTSHPHWGDIVMFGSPAYHVELYGHTGWMLGAHHSGTRVSYKAIYSGAKYYHVKGAG